MNWFCIFLMVLGVIALVDIVIMIVWVIIETSKPPEKETNGDTIRSMDNDELADLLAEATVYKVPKDVKADDYKRLYANWLKQNK